MHTELRNRMKEMDLFAGLTDGERAAVATIVGTRTVRRGDTIFSQGEAGDAAYVVLTGKIDIMVGDRRITTLEKGAVLGEACLLADVKRSATATAAADGTLWQLPREGFQRLEAEGNLATFKIVAKIAAALVHRLAAMNQKLVDQVAGGESKKREMDELKATLMKDWAF